ncbi:MAG: hypothetical protein GTO12_13935 [Proteobacteria bacterium]|nr:hypothetical protein [Pseudomonadota bacterium]
MQEVKEDAGATILIGPFVDEADGVTPISNVTLSGADAAEIMKHDGSTFVDISSLTFSHKQDGWYTLALTSSELDTPGRATVVISDADLCLPVWKDLMVLPANVWDSKYGTDKLEVDIVQCGGSAVAAGAIPNAAAGGNGGLGTVDASNRIAGIQGTKSSLDDLNDLTSANVGDAVWDEVIETAHETDQTAGEHLNALAKNILARTNNQNLNALLGVDDEAGEDLAGQTAEEVWVEATRALTDKAGFTISGTKTTLDDLNDILATDVWAAGTRSLTDKADFALSATAVDAIWDNTSALGALDFGTLLERAFQLLNNRLEVTDASGNASLKALGNGAEIATSNIQDNDTLTDRDEWSWT